MAAMNISFGNLQIIPMIIQNAITAISISITNSRKGRISGDSGVNTWFSILIYRISGTIQSLQVLTAGAQVLTASAQGLTAGAQVLTASAQGLTASTQVLIAGAQGLTESAQGLTANLKIDTKLLKFRIKILNMLNNQNY